MRHDVNLTTVTKAIADPTRAGMLLRLMDGQAHSAGSLATSTGTTPSAATAHLKHLQEAGLIHVHVDGRRRMHSLSSPAVAHAIEALAEISPLLPEPDTRHSGRDRVDTKLRYARTCYSHLGGILGVRITQILQRDGSLDLQGPQPRLQTLDHALLADLGVTAVTAGSGPVLRACVDWTEKQPPHRGQARLSTPRGHAHPPVGTSESPRPVPHRDLPWQAGTDGARCAATAVARADGFARVTRV